MEVVMGPVVISSIRITKQCPLIRRIRMGARWAICIQIRPISLPLLTARRMMRMRRKMTRNGHSHQHCPLHISCQAATLTGIDQKASKPSTILLQVSKIAANLDCYVSLCDVHKSIAHQVRLIDRCKEIVVKYLPNLCKHFSSSSTTKLQILKSLWQSAVSIESMVYIG